MALTDEGTGFNVSMPVAPAYGGGYGNGFGGFGGFGGDWSWIILLVLLCGGRQASEIWPIMDELMSVLQATNPRLYAGVMRKIEN